MKTLNIISCATCKNSIIKHEFMEGFFITNGGCDDCNLYEQWEFDDVLPEKRWANETGQSQFRKINK